MLKVKIKNIRKINTLDRYDLTVSATNNFFANDILIHNTSVVISNIPVKKQLRWKDKIANYFGVLTQDKYYDIIYSSRKVIKNVDINPNINEGYYSEDIWGVVSKKVSDLIPKNWTLYGEIIGYTSDGAAIQGGYDYGCKQGEYKFYVYKISIVNSDGKVIYLTDKQIQEYCDKVGLLYSDTFIYYGLAQDYFKILAKKYKIYLNPNRSSVHKFQEMFLSLLEKEHNEKDCYMCVNKVPEEGIVIRIESLYQYEAYKLKSKAFILKESDQQGKEVEDLESLN